MQPLLKQFKSFLKGSQSSASKSTSPSSTSKPLSQSSIKNYVSDIKHFLTWLNKFTGQKTIKPIHINSKTCQAYKDFLHQNTPPATANRRLSSLRRFTAFLTITKLAPNDPGQDLTNLSATTLDSLLTEFQTFLISQELAPSTIKNYLSDVRNYLLWTRKNIETTDSNLSSRSYT